jgi:predicted transcriptional regulator of viral defense system
MEERGEKRTSGVSFSPLKHPGLLIAELAALQHGVVALQQLLDLGLSARAVSHRVAAGRLHRIHPGVYAVGHARLTLDGRYMAAVLACRPDGALSHRSSAAKRGLRYNNRATIDVISSRRAGRGLRGIDAHTSCTLLPRDISEVDGIRCTSVARTLLDLAAMRPRRVVERAFDQAEVLQVLDARQIEDVLARAGRHRGAAVLRAVLEDHSPGRTLTRNDLEEAFLAICDQARLPRPAVNVWIALEPIGYEADFLWREHGLIAETDGGSSHGTSRAFVNDRVRDQRLMLAGFRVVRFPWQQVLYEAGDVAATLRALVPQAA